MKKMKCFLFVAFAIGCHQKPATGQLEEIDSLITHEQYDSAFVRIDAVDTTTFSQEEYAHYYLLLSLKSYLRQQQDTADMIAKIVIPYYSSTGNHEKLAECYYYQAYGCLYENKLPQAVALYKKAEEQAALTHNNRLHYKIAQSLSYVNEVSGNHLLQLDYAQRSLVTAKAVGNGKWLAYANSMVAIAHSELQNEDSAIIYMRQALPYSQYIEKADLPAFLTNVAYTFKYSQPDSAKKYLWESLSLQEHSNTLQHLADIYYKEGKHDEAYQLLKRALVLDNGTAKDNILHNLLEYDVEHGRTDSVCEKVNEIIMIKDSLLSRLMNDTIKDMQLRFDHETAIHRQETVTANWQKGLLIAFILILLLTTYIAIKRYREKIKMREAQMQINDYMNRIRELERTGKNASEEIDKLNKEIRTLMNNEAPKLKQGRMLYEHIKNNGTLSSWSHKELDLFINYYTAIDFKTVNRLTKTQRKEKLTTHQLFYLLLIEMGKTDEEIANIIGISNSGVRTLKARTKPIGK